MFNQKQTALLATELWTVDYNVNYDEIDEIRNIFEPMTIKIEYN